MRIATKLAVVTAVVGTAVVIDKMARVHPIQVVNLVEPCPRPLTPNEEKHLLSAIPYIESILPYYEKMVVTGSLPKAIIAAKEEPSIDLTSVSKVKIYAPSCELGPPPCVSPRNASMSELLNKLELKVSDVQYRNAETESPWKSLLPSFINPNAELFDSNVIGIISVPKIKSLAIPLDMVILDYSLGQFSRYSFRQWKEFDIKKWVLDNDKGGDVIIVIEHNSDTGTTTYRWEFPTVKTES